MYAIASSSKQFLLPGERISSDVKRSVQESPDLALIRAVANGDKHAMHTLYMRHNVRVYRFILRLINNSSLAEDLVSEVFLDVWRQAAEFKAKSQVSTWLLAIARNKALSALRRRPHERLDEDALAMIVEPADDPETAAENRDRGAIIQRCLSGLSSIHREVLDLVYYHGKSVDEIARIFGLPVGTVKTRMFYARNHLKNSLKMAGIDAF